MIIHVNSLKHLQLRMLRDIRECLESAIILPSKLRPATLLRMRHCDRCFPVNFAKFQRTSFLQSTSGRLLLSPTKKLTQWQSSTTKKCISCCLSYRPRFQYNDKLLIQIVVSFWRYSLHEVI